MSATSWTSLLAGVIGVAGGTRMLRRPQSQLDPYWHNANPRNVRTVGWIALILGVVLIGTAAMSLVEG